MESFSVMLGVAAFLPLMFVGVVLLGLALSRGHLVPRWAALAVLISLPIITVGGFASMQVNALGWFVLAAGSAAAGRVFAGKPATDR